MESPATATTASDGLDDSGPSAQDAVTLNYDFISVTKWSPSDVAKWLRMKGHAEEYIALLCENQRIDGKSLLLLTESDLKHPPIQIKVLGDVKRLYFDILELQHICSSSHLGIGGNPFGGIGNVPFIYFPPSSSNTSHIESEGDCTTGGGHVGQAQNSHPPLLYPNYNHAHISNGSNNHSHNHSQVKKVRRRKRRVSIADSVESQVSDLDEDPQSSCGEPKTPKRRSGNGHENGNSRHHQPEHLNGSNGINGNGKKLLLGYASNLRPEVGKALIAMGYVFIVTWVTALVMVIVHDRVPSMEKYPPLPDLFLDNMPHIPWAFEMCEITGTLLLCIWIGVLFFHKHRFILIRRFFALSGTVFLLRCVTMLITSLSVPGTHLKCNPRPYGDWVSRLYNAYLIWKGAGLSIQGVRTCGDYMFSGHTVALTMLNFFITEYTTRRLYFIHTISWLLNSFGIFFILSAHEHYSIDVFVAFYITSRLFLYYHTLANNQALMHRDSKRTKVWFPLFSFFESSVNGIVPNQYEFPITVDRLKRWGTLILTTMESKWKEIVPHPNEGFFRTKGIFQPKVKNAE